MVLECEYLGRGTDPWGKTRAGFSFRTEIDRQDWGLKWNQAIETGGILVGNKVRIEGELQQLPAGFPVTQFASIVRGEAPVRQSPEEVSIFDSVGFALEDFSALRYLHRQLRARGEALRRIDLIPSPDDPKNLFGLLDRGTGRQAAAGLE